jgi:hypothetical protein
VKKRLTVGARVRVRIVERSEYAHGCADALDGKTGTVDEVSEKDRQRESPYLVAFDTPAPKWWSHQTPARAFWFSAKDLEVVT